jgi:hypothetical protein
MKRRCASSTAAWCWAAWNEATTRALVFACRDGGAAVSDDDFQSKEAKQ